MLSYFLVHIFCISVFILTVLTKAACFVEILVSVSEQTEGAERTDRLLLMLFGYYSTQYSMNWTVCIQQIVYSSMVMVYFYVVLFSYRI